MEITDLSETVSQAEISTADQWEGIEVPKKSCADCGTTKTPLWRGGPAGPKSLCNACGIRSRKNRRAVLGDRGKGKSKNGIDGSSIRLEDSLKRKVAEKQRKKKLGEEEQAAILLMALSYGSVYSWRGAWGWGAAGQRGGEEETSAGAVPRD